MTQRNTFGASESLETIQAEWYPLRTAVVADSGDAQHTTTTSKNTDIPTHAFLIPPRWNVVELAWTGTANNDECTCGVYAARDGGDVHLVWLGTVKMGGQAASDGGYWADTLTSTTTDVWAVDEPVLVDAEGGDRIALLRFDTRGYNKTWVRFTAASITASESVSTFISGY
jgi:hypothetical protein